jgi:hypothetical protein
LPPARQKERSGWSWHAEKLISNNRVCSAMPMVPMHDMTRSNLFNGGVRPISLRPISTPTKLHTNTKISCADLNTHLRYPG